MLQRLWGSATAAQNYEAAAAHSLKYSCGDFLSTFMFRGNTDGSDVLFTGTKKGVVEEKENLGQPRNDAPGA